MDQKNYPNIVNWDKNMCFDKSSRLFQFVVGETKHECILYSFVTVVNVSITFIISVSAEVSIAVKFKCSMFCIPS